MKSLRTGLIYLFLAFLSISLMKNIIDYQKKVAFYKDFKNQYETEKKKNISLHTAYRRENDPNELEKTIRNKLNLLRPGEVAVILPQPTPTVFLPTPTPLPNWMQWRNILTKEANFKF